MFTWNVSNVMGCPEVFMVFLLRCNGIVTGVMCCKKFPKQCGDTEGFLTVRAKEPGVDRGGHPGHLKH